jgi:hypothetical protein
MRPQNIIKIYDTSDTLHYTLTNQFCTSRNGLNDDPGLFSIQLPDPSGTYTDISANWRVKIWLADGVVNDALTPTFTGKVSQNNTTLTMQGYMRVISGKSNSEILQRRIKTRKVWTAVGAGTIAEELAEDLDLEQTFPLPPGVSQKIDTDASSVTMTVDVDTYLDILKKLSDYWVSAGTQVKKDFYVDEENELNWRSRPLRSAGVETLTVGSNIIEYNVVRDFTQLKNHIVVYGRKVPYVGVNDASNNFQMFQIFGRKDPVNGDTYTDDGGWTTTKGTTTAETATPSPQVGANYTQNTTENIAGTYYSEFHRHFTTSLSCEGFDGYGALEFWSMRLAMGGAVMRLYCPDTSNYYEYTIPQLGDVDNTWKFQRFSLGMANVYNATTNPTGQWVSTGSPDWENISGIYFYAVTATGPGSYMGLDGLCFNFGRWRFTKNSAAEIALDEQHDLTLTDDLLNSDAECECRAETLTYQQKDPIIRVDVSTTGNTNLLVGDQIPLTIPAEGLTADNFYVTSVEHNFDSKQKSGWITKVTLVDTVNSRNVPSATPQDAMLKEMKRQRDLGKGYLNKIS